MVEICGCCCSCDDSHDCDCDCGYSVVVVGVIVASLLVVGWVYPSLRGLLLVNHSVLGTVIVVVVVVIVKVDGIVVNFGVFCECLSFGCVDQDCQIDGVPMLWLILLKSSLDVI